jgi:hypothetical protein
MASSHYAQELARQRAYLESQQRLPLQRQQAQAEVAAALAHERAHLSTRTVPPPVNTSYYPRLKRLRAGPPHCSRGDYPRLNPLPPPPPPPRQPPTIDDVIERLLTALNTHQQSTTARFDQLGTTIDTLATHVGDVRKETQDQTKHVSGLLEKSNAIHQVTCRVLGARLEKLEKLIGSSYDGDENKSVSQRLDALSFTVEELLERVRDPHAARMRVYLIFLASLNSLSVVEVPQPAASPVVHTTYPDVLIDLRTPSPPLEPEPEQGPSVHEPRVCDERGTSPIQKRYTDAATNPKTPTPPLSLTCSTGGMYFQVLCGGY